MFHIESDTKVFVLCPAGTETGGPEAIHQLVSILQDKICIKIWYYGSIKLSERYNNTYHCDYLFCLDRSYDNSNNILIVPEINTDYLTRFNNIQKGIWWLSVDNFEMYRRLKKCLYPNNDLIFQNSITHLTQSRYAFEFLKNKGIDDPLPLSDYTRFEESTDPNSDICREDIVLYNPQKGFEFTQKIIDSSSGIQFVPIINMTNEQVKALMDKSKVYIDFGNHPGKDRLPREAAMRNLCVITGRRGAAGNNIDVGIPEKYKFIEGEKDIVMINDTIIDFLQNYDKRIVEFNSYREQIRTEKSVFISEANKVFQIDD